MDAWKQADKEWIHRNDTHQEAHHQEMVQALWVEESAQARQEGWRPTWKKPKLGKLEGAIPRPKANSREVGEMEGVKESTSDTDESNGGKCRSMSGRITAITTR
ncbi:hypothetical protein JVU11DRAFT_6277 [Chiua virens]|nr:hypothetical protein JVU11DRAFT_6277 [Chiua virens]